MKYLKHFLILLGVIFLILLIDMVFIKPRVIKIKFDTIESTKIDPEFNDFLIMYFSEIDYADNNLLNKISSINKTYNPDILIYGGNYNDSKKDFLDSLIAKKAKFAIVGLNESYNEIKEQYSHVGFELLYNKNISIYKDLNYINIIGLAPYLDQDSFNNARLITNPDNLHIAFTSTPDSVNNLSNIDRVYSSTAYGNEYPFQKKVTGHNFFKNDKYSLNNTELSIIESASTKSGIRIFSDNEICLIKLKSAKN